ncbi:hypothetical protein RQP53_08555 [Paucibacter sp. APW11]|uniref:Uncharacterized protein n=1 Tax=Roseateles aquae TaxID=3077235 RepID=A0ABU3P9W3_9BURK|nr:hypothetical protein [Paucibacter sp. APW11]MDT8999313.1 hypothetical protein [Paucibacter sp. APW11]
MTPPYTLRVPPQGGEPGAPAEPDARALLGLGGGVRGLARASLNLGADVQRLGWEY